MNDNPLRKIRKVSLAILVVALGITNTSVLAQSSGSGEDSSTALAKKTQNPISDLISVPFQNNFNFDVGPNDDLQYILNIQPVYPMRLSETWNLIHRPIIPLIDQPPLAPGLDSEFGIGDIQYQAFFSPAKPGELIWGIGPVLQFPTASDDVLGSEKWAAGPGVVVLTTPGPWVVGTLVNNIWSFAGNDDRADVNLMTLQPFINYNLPHGWALGTSPIITANWEADSDDRWTVPIGGGVQKILHLGKLPLNTQLQAYWNVETPDGGADWQLRFQFAFLFPK